jgi:hypothetical protein
VEICERVDKLSPSKKKKAGYTIDQVTPLQNNQPASEVTLPVKLN